MQHLGSYGLDIHRVLPGPMSMVRSGPERQEPDPSFFASWQRGPWIFLEELLPWGHLKLSSTQTEGLGSAASALHQTEDSCTVNGQIIRVLQAL